MKEQYETPLMELVHFESEDVITASNETGWMDQIG